MALSKRVAGWGLAGLLAAAGSVGIVVDTRADVDNQQAAARELFNNASIASRVESVHRRLTVVICNNEATGRSYQPSNEEVNAEFLKPENLNTKGCAVFARLQGFDEVLRPISP